MFRELSNIPEVLIESCINGTYRLAIGNILGHFRCQSVSCGILYLSLSSHSFSITQIELWQYCFSSGKFNFNFSLIFDSQSWWLVQEITLEKNETIKNAVYTQVNLVHYFSNMLENNIKLKKEYWLIK